MMGIVISDLHLFARRSRGLALFESLRARLCDAEVLVFNGDTFDFRWSTVTDRGTSVDSACEWLRQVAGDLPRCRIHLVLGNHDCLMDFQKGLDALAARLPPFQFQWHPYYARLGPALFVHGDCAQSARATHDLSRYRESWQRDRKRGALLTWAYQCVDRLGVTRLVHEWHFPRVKTIQRVAFYLDRACPGWRAETRDCYFGHTHLPFSNQAHEGIRFHNTGSAISKMGFHPICFELPRNGAVNPIGPRMHKAQS